MALNDEATIVVSTGNFLVAPTGTELPEDLLNPGVAWEKIGHTSLEDILSVTSEGGEATTIGTLQNKALRTRYSPRTESFQFTIHQFDKRGLKLFFGSNAPELANGLVGVPSDPVPTTCAWLAVMVDGETVFGVYAPKAEIYRADNMSLDDTENLAGLPLGVTPLVHSTNEWTYALTPLGEVVAATGATAGTPGTYTPSGAVAPANLAAMSTVTASPSTAWTTGQHVVLADASHAYWDGDSWEVGEAS